MKIAQVQDKGFLQIIIQGTWSSGFLFSEKLPQTYRKLQEEALKWTDRMGDSRGLERSVTVVASQTRMCTGRSCHACYNADSEPVGLGWDVRVCIPSKLQVRPVLPLYG